MSFLGKGTKKDLQQVAIELGILEVENLKVIELKKAILASEGYEEEFVKEYLLSVIEDRKGKEEEDELRRKDEEERRRNEEECKRKDELRQKEMEHEIKIRELEIKTAEVKMKQMNSADGSFTEGRNKLGNTFLDYLNMMKGGILDPPSKAEDWPFFFHHVEQMFKLYEVPTAYHGKITLHCLRGFAKGLSSILKDEELNEYQKIKEVILKENRITPVQYKKNFDSCVKYHSESYAQYASRVEAALELYLESRKVVTLQNLKELIVADKIKDTLPAHVKSHILLKETETWLPVSDLVQEIDNFLISVPKASNSSFQYNKFKNSNYGTKSNEFNNYSHGSKQKEFSKKPIQSERFTKETKGNFSSKEMEQQEIISTKKKPLKCFNCQEEGHVKRFCPKVKVNMMSQVPSKTAEEDLEKKGLNEVCLRMTGIPTNEISCELIRVKLGLEDRKFEGIVDSGAEITVLRKSLVPEEYLQSSGKLLLRPAIGSSVEARLVTVPLSLWMEDEEIRPYIQVHAAVVEGLHEEALVTPKVFSLLQEQKKKYLGEDNVREEETRNLVLKACSHNESEEKPDQKGVDTFDSEKVVLNLERKDNSEGNRESPDSVISEEIFPTPVEFNFANEEVSEMDNTNSETQMSQAKLLRKEQLECPTLQKCFAEARQRKNNYWFESDLLYHTGTVGGQKYMQLVVPVSRRKEILKLAHEAPTGGHLASKKTKERIIMSFWWEGVAKDVKKLCESCHDCQLRRKIKVKDRAPIEAVGRPELPFQVVNADILGPIEPKSSRGHQYLLCVMDQHSRWPEAIPIKSLTAKATCEAFIEIFTRTGIPRIIAMDNGTNFAAKLTQEFLKRLGTVPKFSTPGYPQSNGLVERWVGTMKSMLHHAIISEGKGWDKQLPFLLWAYREVPNATTGVSPFLLVHGRPPIGPLAILKSSWEDEVLLPQGIGESIAEYMQKLRKRLEDAAEYADKVAKNQQQKYVHYHNLRSRDTEFLVGDEVVVLIPDSTNRLCAKWKGPGEIIEKRSPHSFTVKLPDGNIKHLHQNKLRKYVQPIRAVGVIYESDEEFGEIQHAPVEPRPVIHQELKVNITPNAVSSEQHKELLSLIKEYKTVFDGELRKANVGSHVIHLKPGVERKQPHIYKVPETLRSNVEKQIMELLRKDLIEHSSAEIVYPLVCVAKKDGTIRLCVDYRELNVATKISPFPMQNSSSLRFKAGKAKFLTTLDILKGYWEIPLEKNSRELTSFVSPKGQYQWKVMPFGLSGAPATFQRTMNLILRSHSDYAESFLDDIIIFSANWEDHLNHIKAILETLKTLNFSANLKKCSFALSKVKYLGHIVGSGEHGPDPEKISAIKDLKFPKTKKALRSLLGLFNYYRDYVPHYANIAKPLTDLTRKCVPNEIPWSEETETSFNLLKNCLCSITSLSVPDMSKPFEIHTDASLTGIGACLMQRDDESKLKPITFASQKLTTAQSKWSTIEREAYAVIWALGKFEMWTYGTPITLHTDHNPLKYLTEGVPKNARLQRWSLALSRYQVSIAHKPGSANTVADALSRIYE